MFGIFKKKAPPAPAPDPAAEQRAKRAENQARIADLQSQIGMLKSKRAAVEQSRSDLSAQRQRLQAELAAAASAVDKNGLARRILAIDKQIASFDGSLTLIDKSIQDHNATIGTLVNLDISTIGDITTAVDLDGLASEVKASTSKAIETGIKSGMVADANAGLVGSASSDEDAAALAAILAEAAPAATAAAPAEAAAPAAAAAPAPAAAAPAPVRVPADPF